jgi:hypothetical protein
MENLISVKTLAYWLMLTGTSIPIIGQTAPFDQKYGSEQDYNKLYYLNSLYIQSWIRSDTTTYNQLLWADDFVQQSSNGMLVSKEAQAIKFGEPRFLEIEYFYATNVSIRFITDNVAMVYAATPYRGVGDQTESWSQYNDVYVKRDGLWKCVSANISPVLKHGDDLPTFKKVLEAPKLLSFYAGTKIDTERLIELNKKHAEGFVYSNSNALKDVLSEDFIVQQSNGLLLNKSQVLEQLNDQQKTNYKANYRIENLMIRFISQNVAMIHAAIIIKSEEGERATQYNDVYVKRDSKWICVAGSNSPIN